MLIILFVVVRRIPEVLTYDTPIINLNTIFYNFVREHSAIGMIPAQSSGIGFDLGKDKWLGLIRKVNERARTPV